MRELEESEMEQVCGGYMSPPTEHENTWMDGFLQTGTEPDWSISGISMPSFLQ